MKTIKDLLTEAKWPDVKGWKVSVFNTGARYTKGNVSVLFDEFGYVIDEKGKKEKEVKLNKADPSKILKKF